MCMLILMILVEVSILMEVGLAHEEKKISLRTYLFEKKGFLASEVTFCQNDKNLKLGTQRDFKL